MRRMAREWLSEPEATLIAVAYAVNPYLLLTVYVRSAFAELLAAWFLPLLVLWIVRDRPARQMFLPLALTMAGVWLTNVPAAIIATYTAVLLIALMTVMRRSSRVFLYGAAGIALGIMLASFYIVPVLLEKSWITPAQLLSAGVRPQENFLFARTGEPEHDGFLRALSWLAVGEFTITGVAMLAARRRGKSSSPTLWYALAMLAAVSLIMMIRVSSLAYRLMPDLQFLQFPWRWLLVTGVAYAVFLVMAVPQFRGKAVLYAAFFLVVIAFGNRALQPPCEPADTPFMISNVFHSGYGYMGTDEYTPAGGDNYEIQPDFPEYRLRGVDGSASPAGARVPHWLSSTYRRQFIVESPQPVTIVLRLMNYPAWQVKVNGATVTPQSDDPTGRMAIALPAGHGQVDVRFRRTADRWIGDGMSLAAVMFVCGFWYGERTRQPL
jgi:hypothetical protein